MNFSLGIVLDKDIVNEKNWARLVRNSMEDFIEKDHLMKQKTVKLDDVIEDTIIKHIRHLKESGFYSEIDDLFDNNGLSDAIKIAAEYHNDSMNEIEVDIDYEEKTATIYEYDYYGECDFYTYGDRARWKNLPLKDGAKHLYGKSYIARIKDIAFKREVSEKEIEKAREVYNSKNEVLAKIYYGPTLESYLDNLGKFYTYSVLDALDKNWYNGDYTDELSDVDSYVKFLEDNFDEDDVLVLVDCHI